MKKSFFLSLSSVLTKKKKWKRKNKKMESDLTEFLARVRSPVFPALSGAHRVFTEKEREVPAAWLASLEEGRKRQAAALLERLRCRRGGRRSRSSSRDASPPRFSSRELLLLLLLLLPKRRFPCPHLRRPRRRARDRWREEGLRRRGLLLLRRRVLLGRRRAKAAAAAAAEAAAGLSAGESSWRAGNLLRFLRRLRLLGAFEGGGY